MNEEYLAYAAGFALTFLISLVLALYAFKKRSIKLHTFFILVMFSICIWSFGSLMEFISPEISTKIFWSKFCWIGITTVSPFLFLFVLSYRKDEKYLKNFYIALLMIIPLIITFLAFSNEWHHLIWTNIIPISTNFGTLLIYKHGPAVWLNLIYSYPLLLIGMILMVHMFINSPKIYKLQVAAVLVGIASPLIINIFYLTRISPVLVDLTPIAFAITSLCAALGVFRFHLLNILPVAHHKLFNNMTNGFFVVDSNERLLEINLTAEKMFRINSDEIGNTFSDIFGKWEQLMSFFQASSENNRDLLINEKWYNIQKTPLYDLENISYGHLFIITDIDKHKRVEEALKENQRTLETLISNLPGVAYKCMNDSNWTMEFVSEGCFELTGYHPEDIIMNKKISYGDIIHPDYRKHVWDNIQNAIKLKLPFENVYKINTADSTEKHVWEQGIGVFSPNGELIALEGFITDITDKQRAEEELKLSLEEKNILLQEIHHRVKNNMQIISSLLSLQSSYVDDEMTLNNLKESQERIKAMALVHEKLYQSDNIVKINFADYINSLVNELFNSYRANKGLIRLNIDVNDIFLDIDTAIPCGLIINELISNIFKHAFIEGKKGDVYIKFFKIKDKYTLIISDNGIGLPSDVDFNNTKTLGLQLVNALVNQLKGAVKISRTNGTEFIIKFSGDN
ncbi:MAG: PAS domain-containing protein [Methanobacterium sp.]|uniref:histidine kinase N-terminal 7TM domain-containing protein n=1 Tax=Methanobacterium sp. TaxID=2164 RepID=UPI003D660007|nr:PAS domain-containing protein [Methanobacterium sp.]